MYLKYISLSKKGWGPWGVDQESLLAKGTQVDTSLEFFFFSILFFASCHSGSD